MISKPSKRAVVARVRRSAHARRLRRATTTAHPTPRRQRAETTAAAHRRRPRRAAEHHRGRDRRATEAAADTTEAAGGGRGRGPSTPTTASIPTPPTRRSRARSSIGSVDAAVGWRRSCGVRAGRRRARAPTSTTPTQQDLLPGVELSLTIEDDQYNKDLTPGAVEKLLDAGVRTSFTGIIGTPNNAAVRDILNEECVPQLDALTGYAAVGRGRRLPVDHGRADPVWRRDARPTPTTCRRRSPTAPMSLCST